MSTIALFLVAFGAMIILTRGPLIFAPAAARGAYLSMVSTDLRMRLFGFFAAALGALIFVIGLTNTGLIAQFLTYLGVLVVALSLGGMIPFPGASRRLAEKVWNAFSPAVLRVIGIISTAFGAALIYYGLSL